MRISKIALQNFGSYPTLSFDFADLGLALVSGDTGSGKSTFMDATAWVIFGITSKEGGADDVKSWDADAPTQGTARIQLSDGEIVVYRRRGSTNDIHWCDISPDGTVSSTAHRGKDMSDTQRLLERRLGVTAELFLVGSYMTQFSKADSFFIAKARDRREVLEKIADQEFAITLGDKAANKRKDVKKEKESIDLHLSSATGRRDTLSERCQTLLDAKNRWDEMQATKIRSLALKFDNFDTETAAAIKNLAESMESLNASILEDSVFDARVEVIQKSLAALAKDKAEAQDLQRDVATHQADIKALDRQIASLGASKDCPTCKRPMEKTDCTHQLAQARGERQGLANELSPKEARLKALQTSLDKEESLRAQLRFVDDARHQNQTVTQQFNNLHERATTLQTAKNPHGDPLKAARAEANPFIKERQDAIAALQDAASTVGNLEAQADMKAERIASLTWLYDKSMELRGLLMARAVDQIQTATNAYLEKHFDAALRVKFDLSDSDKLEVEITNNGFSCPFRCLSGGERTMLKLAFSLSLMRAAQDKAGVSFGMIMLDEPFAGLNSALKVKAFGLLEQLEQEYGTVLVIDHDDACKAQFSKVYAVDKSSGHSEIHEFQPKGH